MFLSESERRKQGVWIPQCRSWIQDGRIRDGHHHQVEPEWMSEVFLCKCLGGKCKWSFFCANGGNQSWQVWIQDGGIQDGCQHQVMSEWMSDVFCARWLKPSWENSRWLSSSSSVRMNEFESEWISLSQSQSRGRCFWVNLRQHNKVSESKMAVA